MNDVLFNFIIYASWFVCLFIYFCVVDGNETVSDENDNNGKGKGKGKGKVVHRPSLSKHFLLPGGITDHTKIYTRNRTNRFAIKWLCKCEVEPTENRVCVKLI